VQWFPTLSEIVGLQVPKRNLDTLLRLLHALNASKVLPLNVVRQLMPSVGILNGSYVLINDLLN
jgi:hypothetical protein